MKTRYLVFFLMVIVGVYASVSAIGHAPDFTLFKAFGYSFGINYSYNAVLKLLCVGLMAIATIIVLQSNEDDSKEQQTV